MDGESVHRSTAELEAGLAVIRAAPRDGGRVECIVRRPRAGEREVLDEARIDVDRGMIGDDWATRACRLTADGSPHRDMQLTIMNARVAALVARTADRWPLAGDQLYVDMNLGAANLPAGTRLAIGSAVIEVTAVPHRGCAKFAERFGHDALRLVNSAAGRELNLRGVNARVVRSGTVRIGDVATKLRATPA